MQLTPSLLFDENDETGMLYISVDYVWPRDWDPNRRNEEKQRFVSLWSEAASGIGGLSSGFSFNVLNNNLEQQNQALATAIERKNRETTDATWKATSIPPVDEGMKARVRAFWMPRLMTKMSTTCVSSVM